MKGEDALVTEFVLDAAGEPLVRALQVLSRLEYPIDDEASFRKALPDPESEKDEIVADLIASAVEPACFPLSSPRNAMEKLHANLPARMQLGGSVPIRLIPSKVSLEPDRRLPKTRRTSEEAVHRWWACREACLDRYANCMSEAGRDPWKAAKCDLRYDFCLKDCSAR